MSKVPFVRYKFSFNCIGLNWTYLLVLEKGRLISGGSVERQFYPDVYIFCARSALRSSSPSLT